MVAAPTSDDVDLERDMVDDKLAGGHVLSGIEDEGDGRPIVTFEGSGSEFDRTTTSSRASQWCRLECTGDEVFTWVVVCERVLTVDAPCMSFSLGSSQEGVGYCPRGKMVLMSLCLPRHVNLTRSVTDLGREQCESHPVQMNQMVFLLPSFICTSSRQF